MWATEIVPHHAQAVEKSELFLAKDGTDPDVKGLAEQMGLPRVWLTPTSAGDRRLSPSANQTLGRAERRSSTLCNSVEAMSSGVPINPGPGTSLGVSLRPMGPGDIAFVTDQHRTHFPENVMGRLGGPFLCRYYRTFLDTPHSVAVIAESDGGPCGYLVGILDTRQHRQLLLRRHGGELLAAALFGLLLHPRMAGRLFARRLSIRLRRLFRQARTTEPGPDPGRVAVLSHVATVEDMRGQGVGNALVKNFVDAAKAGGSDRISLATLDGPEGAGPFYIRQGWHLQARRQTFDGRWIRLYDLELHDVG